MKQTADIMGMPVTVVLVDTGAKSEDVEEVFAYLHSVDEQFSPYKKNSDVSQLNEGLLARHAISRMFENILALSEKTKKETDGYFDIRKKDGRIDPSGLVKGYAIHEAANLLRKKGYNNFYIEIAGDIEVAGSNQVKEPWQVGIENPFNRQEIIKVVYLQDKGIATSGTYIRGQHIYDPVTKKDADEIASISVIASNVYEADRFATAVFAMGEKGIIFLENYKGLEGYMVKKDRTAVMTSGFSKYTESV